MRIVLCFSAGLAEPGCQRHGYCPAAALPWPSGAGSEQQYEGLRAEKCRVCAGFSNTSGEQRELK